MKLNYLLRTLPSSLAHIGDLVDVLPAQEKTVDYVFNKIKLYESRDNEENQNLKNKNGNSSVFKVEKKKDNTCFKCGKRGHFQYVCTSQDNVRSPWRGLRGGRQQQVRRGARYQPQQQQRDGNIYSRGNGSYQGRGAGLRGHGGQQWQDLHNASQGATTF